MKNTLIALTAVLCSVFFFSCKKTCGPGYEGSNCKTEVREKCYGTYTGPCTFAFNGDTSTVPDAQAVVTTGAQGIQYLTDSKSNLSLEIKNNAEYGLPENPATVWFRVPTQTVTFNGNTYSVTEGSGQFEGGLFSYTLSIGSPQLNNKVLFQGYKPLEE